MQVRLTNQTWNYKGMKINYTIDTTYQIWAIPIREIPRADSIDSADNSFNVICMISKCGGDVY